MSSDALERAKIPFTLHMAKTKTMVLVVGFSFPFSAVSNFYPVRVLGELVLAL